MSGRDEVEVLQELMPFRIWLTWRKTDKRHKNGKFKKIPFYANNTVRTGEMGSKPDRDKMVIGGEATVAQDRNNANGVGVAFFADVGLIGIDLDDCLEGDSERIRNKDRILAACEGTYVERSPSGRGLHIFVWGDGFKDYKNHKLGIEVFAETGFMTVTRDVMCPGPIKLMTDELRTLLEGFRKNKVGRPRTAERQETRPKFDPNRPEDVARLKEALPFVDPDGYSEWLGVCHALGRTFQQSDEGFEIACEWAAQSEKFKDRGTEAKMHVEYFEKSKVDGEDKLHIGSIFRWAIDGGWAPGRNGRKIVELKEAGLAAFVDEVSGVLATAGGFFQRDGRLVQVRNYEDAVPDAAGIRRDATQTVVVPLEADALRYELSRVAMFRRGEKFSDCPTEHARALLAAGQWSGLPTLRGIVDAPTLREDGSVVQGPGFDPASGLLLNIDDEWPSVPDEPTRDEAQEALERLMAPFREFDFDEVARSAFAATLLAATVRSTLPTALFTAVIAPTSGAGKTLLVDAVGMIVTGVHTPKRVLPTSDDAEMRKVITAALMAGDRMLVFDNVPRGHMVRSAALDNALTSGTWADRVLGKSLDVRMRFAMTVMLTGNNFTFATDTVRRGLYICIDPKCARPDARTFEIPDLLAHVLERRRELLVAGLTVLRAHHVSGSRERGLKPVGQFVEWSRRVREPLVWCGWADPVLSQEAMRDADPEEEEFEELVSALESMYGGGEFRAVDVANKIEEGGRLTPIFDAWRCRTTKQVSAKLSEFKDKIAGGRTLEVIPPKGDEKVKQFRIKGGKF